MAGTTVLTHPTEASGSGHRTTQQLNLLIADVERLRAAVVALATAASQASSVSTVATAGTLTAALIADGQGTVI